jgi:hypothetical protein
MRGRSAKDGQFRAQARRSVRLRALVTHVHEGWQRPGEVRDLGLGGACFEVEEPLTEGDVVSLSFTAPTLWDPLVVRAHVVWVAVGALPHVTRVGVAFEHRLAASVFALFELVNTSSYE